MNTKVQRVLLPENRRILVTADIHAHGHLLKKLLKEALRNNDMDYIYREGVAQADAGADILDVNVGLPEIDEVAYVRFASVYRSFTDISSFMEELQAMVNTKK